LTVKTSSTKLQKATTVSTDAKTIAVNSREKLEGANIIEGRRSRNTRKSYVLQSDSDEDEEMEDLVDDDAEGESVDEDEDAEGEEDADGDIDMDIPLPPPAITLSKAKAGGTIVAHPATKLSHADTKSDSEGEGEGEGLTDDSLSDLGDDAAEEEGMQIGDEDAEGEDDEMEVDEDADDDEEELDSNGETPMGGSRASTPDLTKLTKRQRARLEEGGSGHLLALPDGKLHDFYSFNANASQRFRSRSI
jgi:Ino eighty subunit 2